MSTNKQIIQALLSQAEITINGDKPWDITINDDEFYNRILINSDLALGETYMAKWWDCPNVDQLIYKLLKADLERKALSSPAFWRSTLHQKFFKLLIRIFNFQTIKKSLVVGRKHYNIGNDLFKLMLDKRMNYTAAIWSHANNLNEAQENKLKLACQKLNLQAGMSVLDIGCGWGAFAKYAAENYGVSVVGISISQEQINLGQELCAGLPITLRFQDYRELLKDNQKFDRIISLGMFEHVGYKNYETYMQAASHCLKEDGIFLLSTIVANSQKKATSHWINTYIFPNGEIPSMAQLALSLEDIFVIENCQNFGPDYDKTLMAWHQNINQHWKNLNPKFDETFQRMWNYYLLSCAGSFRARQNQLWYIVLTKNGLENGLPF